MGIFILIEGVFLYILTNIIVMIIKYKSSHLKPENIEFITNGSVREVRWLIADKGK